MVAKRMGLSINNEYPTNIFEGIEKEEKTTKVRTTFRLSKEAKKQMTIQIAQEGYGMRGKSKWVSETLLEFIDSKTWNLNIKQNEPINSWMRIVIDTELLREKLVVDAVNLEESIRIKLWKSAIDVAIYGSELDEPEYLDISSASVIRAAIMWKISNTITS